MDERLEMPDVWVWLAYRVEVSSHAPMHHVGETMPHLYLEGSVVLGLILGAIDKDSTPPPLPQTSFRQARMPGDQ